MFFIRYIKMKKTFFQERTARQIAKLDTKNAFTANGLVRRIMSLDQDQAMIVRTPITPGRFRRFTANSNEASRKCYKHGEYLRTSQPRTQENAYRCPVIPLGIRARDFARLEDMWEDETNYIGYSFRPVQGRDRRQRKVPFVWILEGARLFAYAENLSPIKVKPYADAKKVKLEGAEVVCEVPSREKKKSRYTLRLNHVPVEGSTERRAVPYSLSSEYNGNSPEHSLYNIRYTWEKQNEDSNVFTFYPQDIAAYIATIKHFNSEHNLTPIEMSPIAIPSKKAAEFYNRLNNNVLIYDPSSAAKDNLRKLHIDEKSIMLGRAVGTYGHDEIMFWDPARDGRIMEYDWQLRGK